MSQSLERRWHALERKLLAHAGELRRQGTLITKTIAGRQYYYVRFYTVGADKAKTHHAVYVGAEPAMVERVRDLLGLLRQSEHEYCETRALMHKLARLVARLRCCKPSPARLIEEDLRHAPYHPPAGSPARR